MFSSVTLSRLECLLGDYPASLEALAPLSSASWTVTVPTGEGDTVTSTAQEVVHAAFSARLSMAYHAGVSFLMLRRYKDATKELADICSFMQRGFKVSNLHCKNNFSVCIIYMARLYHVFMSNPFLSCSIVS
jgi:translation initiation factor 3 subunit L